MEDKKMVVKEKKERPKRIMEKKKMAIKEKKQEKTKENNEKETNLIY